MFQLLKPALLVAILGLAGCSSADRFGRGDDDFADSDDTGADGIDQSELDGANDPRSVAYFNQTIGDRVLFSVDEHVLTPDGQQTVLAQANWLLENTDYNAIIEGHADEQGTSEYNRALSARRANSVFQYMIAQGIAASRLTTIPYGKDRPLEICSEESCYAKNRRSVTVLRAGTGA